MGAENLTVSSECVSLTAAPVFLSGKTVIAKLISGVKREPCPEAYTSVCRRVLEPIAPRQ